LVDFFVKTFRRDVFWCVFELPSPRNTRKRDKTKQIEEKLTSKFLSIFLEKVFDMDFLQNDFYGVFELPLPRNKSQGGKKSDGGWVGLGFSKCTGGPSIFLPAPRAFFWGGIATFFPEGGGRVLWCLSARAREGGGGGGGSQKKHHAGNASPLI
jgi:hypothetical protein